MKRIITAVLCLALILSLVACSRNAAPEQRDTKAQSYEDVYRAISGYRAKSNFGGELSDGAVYNFADLRVDDAEEAKAYSDTNVQVEGIDEGDIVKTDGEYIYAIMDSELRVYRADGENTKQESYVNFGDEDLYAQEMYLCGDRLAVICCEYDGYFACCDRIEDDAEASTPKVKVLYYDISNPAEINYVNCVGQDGYYVSSRVYDGDLYVVTNYFLINDIEEDKPETYIPRTYCDDEGTLTDADCICITAELNGDNYTVAVKYDAESGAEKGNLSFLGNADTLYMSKNNLYIASCSYFDDTSEEYEEDGYTVTDTKSGTKTAVYRIDLATMKSAANTTVLGLLKDQFSMDEFDGNLRLVTTSEVSSFSTYYDKKHDFTNIEWHEEDCSTSTGLYILDSGLNTLAKIEGLAEDEYIRSVRFDGDYVYFCTFRQVDPLFAVNVSDPTKPEILSELKISGFSEYLHPWSENLLFGLGMEADEATGRTESMKLVMFDISNKADVKALHTLNIDGYYSEALYNHHALLISPEKGIIGFGTDSAFEIYGYDEGSGFSRLASVSLNNDWNAPRGMYIGDFAYIIDNSGVTVIDMQSFEIITKI
ncbi:MAG: beta-propeller domain-containing protein [Bacillota bacterium]|nr:beta-propeller domain-containing protein [Bacillota bacterium]